MYVLRLTILRKTMVASGIGHINEVKLRRARLVPGFGNHLWRVYHSGIFQANQAHSAWPSVRGSAH